MKKHTLTFVLTLLTAMLFAQHISFEQQVLEPKNVKAAIVQLEGEDVLKVERDLKALPFDINNMVSTVDEPTYVRLKAVNLENGTIEVKVLSRLLPSAPEFARGFIGIAFHIDDDDSKFQSVYLRPTNGRADNQLRRNHTIQYFSYPDYKFDRLRKEFPEMYDTYADIGLDEWITLRLEIKDEQLRLYLNDQRHPAFVADKIKGGLKSGSIGLWVDIGTEGFFKDLKIVRQ